MRLYDADKEDRQLRSYEIQVLSLFRLKLYVKKKSPNNYSDNSFDMVF